MKYLRRFVDWSRDLVRQRPLTTLGISVALAIALGVGVGLAETGREDDLETELAGVQAEADEAVGELDDARDELADLESALFATERDARRAEGRAKRARERATSARQAANSSGQEGSDSGADGTYTVGDFTFSDVQVSEDGVGDFEVRARVTNSGESQEFVSLQVTLFNGGSVVSDLDAIEDFDSGQTRTVTFIGVDEAGPWDDLEFTVDAGF